MVTSVGVDPGVAFSEQLALSVGPIVLINRLQCAPDDVEQLVRCYQEDSAFMKRQPGFISAQLHRGIGPSTTFVNVAVWESTGALQAAVTSPEFQAHLATYPPSVTAAPHVFTRVAVPGVCTARTDSRDVTPDLSGGSPPAVTRREGDGGRGSSRSTPGARRAAWRPAQQLQVMVNSRSRPCSGTPPAARCRAMWSTVIAQPCR